MTDTIVINGHRSPTMVQRRVGGGLMVRQGGRYVLLDAAELDQVLAFVRDEPELGRLARFKATDSPVAPRRGVMAAPTDEPPNWLE